MFCLDCVVRRINNVKVIYGEFPALLVEIDLLLLPELGQESGLTVSLTSKPLYIIPVRSEDRYNITRF